MKKSDTNTTIQELKDLIQQFAEDRDWVKHHSKRNLAISISIEAAELLENYQWDRYVPEGDKKAEDELADILKYVFAFAETHGIDISTVFRDKLDRDIKKYPVELFNKDTNEGDNYMRIKQAYRDKKADK